MKATARKDDPITSHQAADRMNEFDQVSEQAIQVLLFVKIHGPITAKKLDQRMKRMTYWTCSEWDGWAHRRMSDLITAGYVERTAQGREGICEITKKGRMYLKGKE